MALCAVLVFESHFLGPVTLITLVVEVVNTIFVDTIELFCRVRTDDLELNTTDSRNEINSRLYSLYVAYFSILF